MEWSEYVKYYQPKTGSDNNMGDEIHTLKESRNFLSDTGNLIEELKDYFKTTPEEKIRKDWKELEKYANTGDGGFWDMCNKCKNFDGYDMCLSGCNFGSVTDGSLSKCRKLGLFKPLEYPESINCISMMVGRFQPFTVTDLENLKVLKDETGNPVTLVYIRSHQWYENTPFKSSTVRRMLEKVKETYPDLVNLVVCSDEWDPSDVLKKHGIFSKKSIVSDHNSIKAAIARLALSMDSEEEFYRTVPECLHDMYPELRKEMSRNDY